ncbi:MAG: hypothetical protein ACLVJB_02455 [Christensenellales bacterium]
MRGCALFADAAGPAADIPIIAMTANAFEDVRERIFDAGMDGYLASRSSRTSWPAQ